MSRLVHKCLCIYFVPMTTCIHEVIYSLNDRNSNTWVGEKKELNLEFQWKHSSDL